MEDYDVFNEMKNLSDNKVVAFIEDDEDFVIENLINSNLELIPIRLSYDLSNFSKDYVDKTKNLFIYYYSEDNAYDNELLRIKKHFVHYQRKPFIAYIPDSKKYLRIKKILQELDVKCICDRKEFMNRIIGANWKEYYYDC